MPVSSKSPGEPRCADCNHEAREHGARGHGACRHGESLSQALGLRPVTDDPPCLCKRFRVRPRVGIETYAHKFRDLVASARRAGITVVVDIDSIAIRLVKTADVARGADLRELGEKILVDEGCGGGGSRAGGYGAI